MLYWIPSFLKAYFKIWTSNRQIYVQYSLYLLFKKDFIHLYLERGEGREKGRERNINVWLPLAHPLLGTWPTTQACALIGNWTGGSFGSQPMLNPLSYTSQGYIWFFRKSFWLLLSWASTLEHEIQYKKVWPTWLSKPPCCVYIFRKYSAHREDVLVSSGYTKSILSNSLWYVGLKYLNADIVSFWKEL